MKKDLNDILESGEMEALSGADRLVVADKGAGGLVWQRGADLGDKIFGGLCTASSLIIAYLITGFPRMKGVAQIVNFLVGVFVALFFDLTCWAIKDYLAEKGSGFTVNTMLSLSPSKQFIKLEVRTKVIKNFGKLCIIWGAAYAFSSFRSPEQGTDPCNQLRALQHRPPHTC